MGRLLVQANSLTNLPADFFAQVAVPKPRPATALGGVAFARLAQHGDACLDAIVGDLLAPVAGGGLASLGGFQFGIGQVQAIDKKHQVGPATNALVTVRKLPLESGFRDHPQQVLLEQVHRIGFRPRAGCFVPQHKRLPGKAQAFAQHKGGICLGLDLWQQNFGEKGMQEFHLGVVALHRLGEGGSIQRAAFAQEMQQIAGHDPARGVDVGGLAEYPVQPARCRCGQVGNEDAVLKVAFLETLGHDASPVVSGRLCRRFVIG